jgi:hypothetical protein
MLPSNRPVGHLCGRPSTHDSIQWYDWKEVSDLSVLIQADRWKPILGIAGHGLVLKDVASYRVPGTTNESHEIISNRIAGLLTEFFKLWPREYEAEAVTTWSLYLVK